MKTMMAMMLCVLALVAGAAQAGALYKCTANGKVSYADQPCTDGHSRSLAIDPAPDASAARAALARDQARLADLQRARASGDAQAERAARAAQRAARADAGVQRQCARLALRQQWAEQDAARAPRASAQHARLKAQRQAQLLAVDCPR
jgi:hypothetical protein